MLSINPRKVVVVLVAFLSILAFVAAASSGSAAEGPSTSAPCFGMAKDVSEIDPGIRYVGVPVPRSDCNVETIQFSISPEECSIHQMDGFVYLKVGDLKPYAKPGEPLLPMKTVVMKLPCDAEVIGAEMTSGNYMEIADRLKIVPMRQPSNGSEGKAGMLLADEKVYSLERYFPGGVVSYNVGSDGENQVVYLRIFPVQYIPRENKVIVITNAEVSVYYKEVGVSDVSVCTLTPPIHPKEPLFFAKNLIITPPELFEQAKELDRVHGNRLRTEVVNTTWIYLNYANASDPPYDGYKNDSIEGWSNINGYNYTLAKKIIAFLDDRNAHPMLKYVTLFGNARLVPPSYYMHIDRMGYTYDKWVPADFFYASPDYDLVANYAIGRLPVNNSEEAEHVVQKIQDWKSNLSYDWFKNVALMGGDMAAEYGSGWYSSERATVEYVNKGYFDGMNITKYYLSDDRFTAEKVQSAYNGGYGFIYQSCHGYGDAMVKSDPYEGKKVILINVSDMAGLPKNPRVPIIISESCMNGAFDTNLYPNDWTGYSQQISFGEGVLLSNASGIAYIGGSRSTLGGTDSYLDKGRPVTIRTYCMAAMVEHLCEAFSKGVNKRRSTMLGDITNDAMERYLMENDVSSSINDQHTYFELTLLGDPALKFPTGRYYPQKSYITPFCTALEPDHYTDDGRPVYNTSTSINIETSTDSPEISTKRIDTFELNTVERVKNSTSQNSFTYSFSSTNETEYLVRMETEDGKEDWIFLTVAKAWTGGEKVLVVDDDDGGANDYEKYYEDALTANNYPYDTWNVALRGSPDNLTLKQYEIVVWLAGLIPPTQMGQEYLADYLDSGGKLFISGQLIPYFLDYYGSSEDKEFHYNYLHAKYAGFNFAPYPLEGVVGDPIGHDLTINISGGDGANNQEYPCMITPNDQNATMVFNYTQGGCGGIKADTGVYKVVYFSFGFEAIDNASDRNTVMGRIIDWFDIGYVSPE